MVDEVRPGNYVSVEGYISRKGMVKMYVCVDQVVFSDGEGSVGGVLRRSAKVSTTRDVGKLLAENPVFGGGSSDINPLSLVATSVETRVACDDLEVDSGQWGYRFSRPASFDELVEIIQAYDEFSEPYRCAP